MTIYRNSGILISVRRLKGRQETIFIGSVIGGELVTTLKQEREKAKLTQAELARMSGVPQAVISDIEAGVTKNPRFETVKKLCSVLNFNITELQIVGEAAGR